MNFNQIILEKLGLIFEKYNLHISEQWDNYLNLHSDNLVIILTHNQREDSNTFFLGKNDKNIHNKVEIDNDALKLFFNSDLKLSDISVDVFVNNLVLFFENEGKSLLMGDLNTIRELEKFDMERSQLYTQDILEKQILVAADNAWDNCNYKEFVNLINQANKDKLPSSYQLKYKIANRRLAE